MGVYVSMENGTVSGEIVHQLTVLNPGCPGQGIWCMECEGKLTGVFICQWRMGLCQERLSTN